LAAHFSQIGKLKFKQLSKGVDNFSQFEFIPFQYSPNRQHLALLF